MIPVYCFDCKFYLNKPEKGALCRKILGWFR